MALPEIEKINNAKTGMEILTNNNGIAIKFSGGILICYGTVNFVSGASNMTSVTLPTSFLDTGYSISLQNIFSNSSAIIWSVAAQTKNSFNAYPKISSTLATPDVNCSARFTAIGKWK